jgi:hypothetical protein
MEHKLENCFVRGGMCLPAAQPALALSKGAQKGVAIAIFGRKAGNLFPPAASS